MSIDQWGSYLRFFEQANHKNERIIFRTERSSVQSLAWGGTHNSQGTVTRGGGATTADLTLSVVDYKGDVVTTSNTKLRLKVSGDATFNVTTGTVDTNAVQSANNTNEVVVTPISGVIGFTLTDATDETVEIEVFRETADEGPHHIITVAATKQVTYAA